MLNKLIECIKNMEAEIGFTVAEILERNEPWEAICDHIREIVNTATLGDTLYSDKVNVEEGSFTNFELVEIHLTRKESTYLFEGIPKVTTCYNFNDVETIEYTKDELVALLHKTLDEVLEKEFNITW